MEIGVTLAEYWVSNYFLQDVNRLTYESVLAKHSSALVHGVCTYLGQLPGLSVI